LPVLVSRSAIDQLINGADDTLTTARVDAGRALEIAKRFEKRNDLRRCLLRGSFGQVPRASTQGTLGTPCT
jgi:hypothetical protein